MGKRTAYRRVAQLLWGGWELYGFISWIGGGVLSNVIAFMFIPFAQALPIWLKVLYGIGLFVAVLIVSVIIIRILQALFKPQTDSGLSQSVSESQVQGNVFQVGRDVNVNMSSEQSLVLTMSEYAIGIEGYRGYPDNPAGADILCLWVVMSPASRLDTLDLLVSSSPPIPAIDWSGKIEAAFHVYYVSAWRYKGKVQVELVGKAGSNTHSSGRKPIDFNMEPFGRHTF